ncbi:hypothetical protein [uncultured Sulfitobacter sp.]|uniref:hypothetical protein n=1 Tax=uncultured Sulfitobacter sp. TaxID=191468 RepID=UPI00262A9420|nr:hypothetical protein [uncultured Sulfitobacter sp.]
MSILKTAVDVLASGAGTGRIAAASPGACPPCLEIATVDPADMRYRQLGWQAVETGVFTPEQTARRLGSPIAKGVECTRHVDALGANADAIVGEGGRCSGCAGQTLHRDDEPALETHGLVQDTSQGSAVFTQPMKPGRCAGTPEKAQYLPGDVRVRRRVLQGSHIPFNSAGWRGVYDATRRLEAHCTIRNLGDVTNAPTAKNAAAARLLRRVGVARMAGETGQTVSSFQG